MTRKMLFMLARMKTGWRITIFGLAILLCRPVLAGPYEDAAAAYMRRSYTEALQLWLPLAEQGHAAAQYNLGAMYENGQGVPRD